MKSEKIINAFSEFDLKKISVRFSETSYSGLNQHGGITKNANLYYCDNFLIFTPSKKNYFNRFYNNLPTILISKKTDNLPLSLNYKIVEDISINEQITLTYLDFTFVKRRVELLINSETNKIELNKAITDFKTFQ